MDPYSLDHIVLPSSFANNQKKPMEAKGFEPLTLGLQSRCSSQLSYAPGTNKRKEGGTGEEAHYICRVFHPTDDILLTCLRL